jgi:hypothetical protein
VILLLPFSGVVPDGLGGLLSFLALFILLWYQWFVAKTGLEIAGALPIAFVGGEFLLGQIIRAVTFNLLHG